MLWREEIATEGSRWEIKKIEEYDPERLEAEGQILPLPPPLLGAKHYMWKNAPRTVPVNQDPLRWLGLKPRDWQVSGNQIVPNGVGGYDPDSEEPGDMDCDARCPDFPSHGSIEMWGYFKRLMNLESQEKHKITWKEAEADVAHITRSEGWETALTIYLMEHPEKVSKWFQLGAPISPPPEEIFNQRLAEMRERHPEDSEETLEKELRATLIGFGWPTATAGYRLKENPTRYSQEVSEWYWKRRSQEDPDLMFEEVQDDLEENWSKISSLYEFNRIRIQREEQEAENPTANSGNVGYLTVEVLRRLNAEMKAKYLKTNKSEGNIQREMAEQKELEMIGGRANMPEEETGNLPRGSEFNGGLSNQEFPIQEQPIQKETPADQSSGDLPKESKTNCGTANQETLVEEQPQFSAGKGTNQSNYKFSFTPVRPEKTPAVQPSEEQLRKNQEEEQTEEEQNEDQTEEGFRNRMISFRRWENSQFRSFYCQEIGGKLRRNSSRYLQLYFQCQAGPLMRKYHTFVQYKKNIYDGGRAVSHATTENNFDAPLKNTYRCTVGKLSWKGRNGVP
jgi:hypothetical protein